MNSWTQGSGTLVLQVGASVLPFGFATDVVFNLANGWTQPAVTPTIRVGAGSPNEIEEQAMAGSALLVLPQAVSMSGLPPANATTVGQDLLLTVFVAGAAPRFCSVAVTSGSAVVAPFVTPASATEFAVHIPASAVGSSTIRVNCTGHSPESSWVARSCVITVNRTPAF